MVYMIRHIATVILLIYIYMNVIWPLMIRIIYYGGLHGFEVYIFITYVAVKD